MSAFIYPTDLDLIYVTEDSMLRTLGPISNINNGGNSMVKELKYTLSVDSGQLVSTADSSNEMISQYQEALVRVTFDSTITNTFSSDGYVVIMHLGLPTSATLDQPDEFDYHIHLIPDVSRSNSYWVNISEFIGAKLNVGELNSCQYKFELLIKGPSMWESAVELTTHELGLYKTNTSLSSKADDLANAFAVLSKINEYVEAL